MMVDLSVIAERNALREALSRVPEKIILAVDVGRGLVGETLVRFTFGCGVCQGLLDLEKKTYAHTPWCVRFEAGAN